MNRTRAILTVPIALTLALVLAPTLSACSGNPIKNIIEGATGGEVELPSTSVPAGFPAEVPLVDGEVTFGGAFGDGDNKVFNVTVKVSGLDAFDGIRAQLEAAGFVSAANGSAGTGSTGAFTNDTWGVLVVVSGDDTSGFFASYTVTNATRTK
ncbi:MAG: hypothetical protein ACOH1T_03230 [Microbacteriaceae bacterium]